jgi:hypothetical protein
VTAHHPWGWLVSLWQPHHVVTPGPADDLLVTEMLQIRRTLHELARLRRSVALQASNGEMLGSGVLGIDGAEGVAVQLAPDALASDGLSVPWPLNATASGPGGMVLFTLVRRLPDRPGVLRARWPDQLIQVQSRRHERLTGLAGRQRRAWLTWSDAAARLPVCDLSEEGVGLEVAAFGWLSALPPGSAVLHLDEASLPVPMLEVVHSRPGQRGGPGTVGARMLGMAEDHVDSLRRWMQAVQAEGRPPAGAA